MEFRDGDLWLEFNEGENLPFKLSIDGVVYEKNIEFISRLKRLIKAYDDYYNLSYTNEIIRQISESALKNEGKVQGILEAIKYFKGGE